ncbi:MAG: hypothetical protein WBM38_04930 [Arenicellales bacterium]|jgi:hypothetical protein
MNSLAIFDTFQLLAEMACVAQQNGYLLWMLACCQEHNWPVLDTIGQKNKKNDSQWKMIVTDAPPLRGQDERVENSNS